MGAPSNVEALLRQPAFTEWPLPPEYEDVHTVKVISKAEERLSGRGIEWSVVTSPWTELASQAAAVKLRNQHVAIHNPPPSLPLLSAKAFRGSVATAA